MNFSLEKKRLQADGYIQNLKGVDYIKVAGLVYMAHESGALLGIDTEEVDTGDAEYVTMKATATLFPFDVIEKIATNPYLTEEQKNTAISTICLTGGSVFTSLARTKRHSDEKGFNKSAAATNPIEFCGTKAIGRALRFAGIGKQSDIATLDEMMEVTQSDPIASAGSRSELYALAKTLGIAEDKDKMNAISLQKFKKSLTKLTESDVKEWIKELSDSDTSAAVPF